MVYGLASVENACPFARAENTKMQMVTALVATQLVQFVMVQVQVNVLLANLDMFDLA